MDLFDAIGSRKMTRRFSDRSLPEEHLHRVLDAARRGPSAGATSGLEILVFEDETERTRFWESASEPLWRSSGRASTSVLRAPVIAMPVADPAAYVERYSAADKAASSLHKLPAESWPAPYWIVDASFAVMLMLLAATGVGIGALFFRLHAPQRDVLSCLGLAPGLVTIGAVALGYPADDALAAASGSADPLAPPIDRR